MAEIPSLEVVPGDIVLLEAGNLIPADGRVVESINLKIDEAALTGESEPVEKHVESITDEDAQLGDRVNMLYMGTVATYGRGSFVVTETGMETELGKIATMIQSVDGEKTPLQRRLDQLGKTLAWAALGIIIIVVIVGRLRLDTDWETLFLTGVSMAVAAIPESLAAVVTITLALGSQRLAEAQCTDAPFARRRNPRFCDRHLLGQDGHADREPHDRDVARCRRQHPGL